MQAVILYRYARADGGITASPVAPTDGIAYDILYRLIADDGKVLTNGTITTACVDAASSTGWAEIDDPGGTGEAGEKAAAFDILMGVSK